MILKIYLWPSVLYCLSQPPTLHSRIITSQSGTQCDSLSKSPRPSSATEALTQWNFEKFQQKSQSIFKSGRFVDKYEYLMDFPQSTFCMSRPEITGWNYWLVFPKPFKFTTFLGRTSLQKKMKGTKIKRARLSPVSSEGSYS